jgi:hypothetical protein
MSMLEVLVYSYLYGKRFKNILRAYVWNNEVINKANLVKHFLSVLLMVFTSSLLSACDDQRSPRESHGEEENAPSRNDESDAHNKIAVLGWGSLIWNPGSLDASSFKKDGPKLPLQFSRISRNNIVTLVSDLDFGVPVQTWYALSKKTTLRDAIENLRVREGTSSKNIAYVDLEKKIFSLSQIKRYGKTQQSDTEYILGRIKHFSINADEVIIETGTNIRSEMVSGEAYLKKIIAWAVRHGFMKGVIWTGLPSNWYEKTTQDWSFARAKVYVHGLDDQQKNRAFEYINKAPLNVKTALNAAELLN